eukprot:TRINITY_DN55532_c0_g1_i1.p1 TRINITY_DN55532_c0_g1~~TRINITY_DN55532_c0_g1_i1.p1  ORF type:complete len:484 (-),score=77.15 TRINITY_DN55532_c0_g1_i1:22-1473(-)
MGKKRKHDEDAADVVEEAPPEYSFVKSGDDWLRLVAPYKHCFRTFAKARWLGRALHDVCAAEFGARPPEYYRQAILEGRMRVAGVCVQPSYILRNGDLITHETLRHEPPVLLRAAEDASTGNASAGADAADAAPVAAAAQIAVAGETEEMVAVDKMSTIPVHPSGAYYHNTLLHILAHERPQWRRGVSCTLHPVHRLDRLTSGLVLLAKTSAVAQRVSKEIVEGGVRKEYLARVQGKFPMLAKGTEFEIPEAWRSATIRRADVNAELRDAFLLEAKRETAEDTASAASVKGTSGSLDTPCVGGGPSSGLSYASLGFSKEGAMFLLCPIRCVSHRDGVHECHPQGRQAATEIVGLGYDSGSDTSLVRCSPLTGRTHQIRIHLQQLGFPIANDPCYGGVMDLRPADGAKTEGAAADGERTGVGAKAPEFTETQLRCRGIWLHALRYSGSDFSFETAKPPWAQVFEAGSDTFCARSDRAEPASEVS